MLRTRHSRALLLGAFTLISACSDLPTAPEVEPLAPTYGLLGDLVGVVRGTVDGVVQTVATVLSPVLNREDPLRRDEVVSETIGRWGGTIVLPRAGLTVTVPPGALDRPTRITVKAPAGDLLGYEFAPHGLQFDRPVILTQEVSRTAAARGLEVVYFDGDLQPTVGVLEVLPVATFRDRAVFAIEHFSGYAFRQRGYVVATD
ncbi:MAG: hypothetical protein AB7T31_02050 [Gemmatimonadales bacterium]